MHTADKPTKHLMIEMFETGHAFRGGNTKEAEPLQQVTAPFLGRGTMPECPTQNHRRKWRAPSTAVLQSMNEIPYTLMETRVLNKRFCQIMPLMSNSLLHTVPSSTNLRRTKKVTNRTVNKVTLTLQVPPKTHTTPPSPSLTDTSTPPTRTAKIS